MSDERLPQEYLDKETKQEILQAVTHLVGDGLVWNCILHDLKNAFIDGHYRPECVPGMVRCGYDVATELEFPDNITQITTEQLEKAIVEGMKGKGVLEHSRRNVTYVNMIATLALNFYCSNYSPGDVLCMLPLATMMWKQMEELEKVHPFPIRLMECASRLPLKPIPLDEDGTPAVAEFESIKPYDYIESIKEN